MQEIWYAIPSACDDLCASAFAAWRDMGYSTAVLIDGPLRKIRNADLTVHVEKYAGYGASVNTLCARIGDADFVVTGGHDVLPDPKRRAREIADECLEHFHGTLGIMQPTGDDFGALADKSAAVSPWIGREFRQRAYGGKGPYWEAYHHFYDDSELSAVATLLNCMWWRDDVNQLHEHWTRRQNAVRPEHLEKVQNLPFVNKPLFEQRRAAGFPGHELIAAYDAAARQPTAQPE